MSFISTVLMGVAAIWTVLVYLIGLYPKYYMFKEAGITPWLAFIPFVGDAMVLKLIGASPLWYILLCVVSAIPGVGAIISPVASAIIYWCVADVFGLGTAGKVLSLFFWPITQWYIALTGKHYND